MDPPRTTLDWEEVVNYACLAEFDLLRDTRQDVRERPWARPANRLIMDKYFKLERAREEITRLNVEIRRVLTHLQDEECFLLSKEKEILNTNAALAFQVRLYRLERTRFAQTHRQRFKKLASCQGVQLNLTPGVPIDKTLRNVVQSTTQPVDAPCARAVPQATGEHVDWEENGDLSEGENDAEEDEILDTTIEALQAVVY